MIRRARAPQHRRGSAGIFQNACLMRMTGVSPATALVTPGWTVRGTAGPLVTVPSRAQWVADTTSREKPDMPALHLWGELARQRRAPEPVPVVLRQSGDARDTRPKAEVASPMWIPRKQTHKPDLVLPTPVRQETLG